MEGKRLTFVFKLVEQEALENIADAIHEYLEVVTELNRDKVRRMC